MNPGLAKLPAVAAALPGATEDIKWEADRVFSVGAKMFAVFHPAKGRPTQCSFKVEDERFLELTGLPGIQPAPYLARAHWVLVTADCPLPASELQALLKRSHALVAGKLTKKLQKELGLLA